MDAERQGSRSGNSSDKPKLGAVHAPFREEIVKRLPEFVRMCDQDVEVVMLHQDAFAAAYQDEEYRLLGIAIKYAGLRGKEVHIIGENRATLKRDEA